MPPEVRGRRGGRFAAAAVGALVASVAWLVVVVTTATTPDEAREQRAAPRLPVPSVVLRETTLRQQSWYPCEREAAEVAVTTPRPPAGYRSVVTALARPGTPATTGTVLARVSGQPVVAVVSTTAFYRDLVVGDRGPDVTAFLRAVRAARGTAVAGGTLTRPGVLAWRELAGVPGAADRIPVATLVAVPPGAEVESVEAATGQPTPPGSRLMTVAASSDTLRCDVPDPTGAISSRTVTLELDGRPVGVRTVVTAPRSQESAGSVRVTPRATGPTPDPGAGSSARLGIISAATSGPVLVAPLAALTTSETGATSVVVLEDGDRRQVPVTLGITAQGLVQVEGRGLRDGTSVALFDTAADRPDAGVGGP